MSYITFDTMPVEIASTIFFYCDPNTLLKLERVCKFFKEIIVDHPVWNHHILQENHFLYREANETSKQAYFLNHRLELLDKDIDDAAMNTFRAKCTQKEIDDDETNPLRNHMTLADFNIDSVFRKNYCPNSKREIIDIYHPIMVNGDNDGCCRKFYSLRSISFKFAQAKINSLDIEKHCKRREENGGTIFSIHWKKMTPEVRNQIRTFFRITLS
ncbi:MAG: F-box protein [Parachlamydiales bacterium]|nr:F-box protein [Parachlamydiales bacterium]